MSMAFEEENSQKYGALKMEYKKNAKNSHEGFFFVARGNFSTEKIWSRNSNAYILYIFLKTK